MSRYATKIKKAIKWLLQTCANVDTGSNREAMAKPYDSKKSYWCPDGQGGFSECLVDTDDGTKASVMIGHEVSEMVSHWSKGISRRSDWSRGK